MGKDYLDQLGGEYDTHIAAIDEIVTRAKEANRLLTDDEDAECKRHQEAAEGLQPQMERWAKLRSVRTANPTLRPDLPPAVMSVVERVDQTKSADTEDRDEKAAERSLRRVHRTAGQFIHDQFLARQKGDVAAGERVQRALALQTTAQTPGLLPTPFVGDILGRVQAVRPVVNASNQVPLPASGMSWKRPKITQHTAVDVQAVEKTEVASQALVVGSIDADFATLAGAVNMSIQEIERTDPSALDLVLSDLAAMYGKRSELFAVEALSEGTAGSETVALSDSATIEEVRAALYQAASLIYGATDGAMPNVIFAAMDKWAVLGKYARAINPQDRDTLSTPDSLQLSIAGIPVVVSPALWEGALIAARSDYFEVAERPGSPVELRALEVGILGYEIGVYGMMGALVTEEGAFVHLGTPGS